MKYIKTSKNTVRIYSLSSNMLKCRSRFPRTFEVDMVVTKSIVKSQTSDDVDVFLHNEIYYPVIDKAINMKIL